MQNPKSGNLAAATLMRVNPADFDSAKLEIFCNYFN